MDWTSLLPLAAITVMFFLMMHNGGGCCGGGHSPTRGKRQEPADKDEAPPAREPLNRK